MRVGIESLYVYQAVSQAVSADWMVCNYQVSTDKMFQACQVAYLWYMPSSVVLHIAQPHQLVSKKALIEISLILCILLDLSIYSLMQLLAVRSLLERSLSCGLSAAWI